MIFACALFVTGSVLFAFSDSFSWLLTARALQGIGAGVTVPACTVVLTNALPPDKRGRAWGIFGAGHGLGVILALFVMPPVADAAGYKGVFLTAAAFAAVLGLGIALLRPVRALPSGPQRLPGARHLARSVRTVAANRRVLLLALFNVTTLGVGVGALAWTPHYLEIHFGSSAAGAGQLTAMVGAAQLVGNPIGAAAMSRWGKLPVITVSLVLLTVTMLLVPFASSLGTVCLLGDARGLFQHDLLLAHVRLHPVRRREAGTGGAGLGRGERVRLQRSPSHAVRVRPHPRPVGRCLGVPRRLSRSHRVRGGGCSRRDPLAAWFSQTATVRTVRDPRQAPSGPTHERSSTRLARHLVGDPGRRLLRSRQAYPNCRASRSTGV